jgi:formylglycine-generating enzyme required for sulfatase activity
MIECRIGMDKDALVPVLIEPITKDATPADLRFLNYLDLSDWSGEEQHEGWRRTLRSLSKLLGRELAGAAVGAAPPQQRTTLAPAVEPDMVRIPCGRFAMGSPKSEERYLGYARREEPQHGVRIERAFALGRHPVTVGEFRNFFADTGYDMGDGAKVFDGAESAWRAGAGWQNPGFEQRDNHPVCCISWFDAQAYVAWLNTKSDGGYRLPSEAEWEYACRAGTRTPFHVGATITTEHANFDGRFTYGAGVTGVFRAATTPVGSFGPNAFGLLDMHGNVWEWTDDCWHGDYIGAPVDGSAWTEGGDCTIRVGRGGSWGNPPASVRSAHRVKGIPQERSNLIGFRVARTIV